MLSLPPAKLTSLTVARHELARHLLAGVAPTGLRVDVAAEAPRRLQDGHVRMRIGPGTPRRQDQKLIVCVVFQLAALVFAFASSPFLDSLPNRKRGFLL